MPLVLKVPLVFKVPLVPPDLLEQMGQRVQQVPPEQPGSGRPVPRAQLVFRVPRGQVVLLVLPEPLAHKALRGYKVPRVR